MLQHAHELLELESSLQNSPGEGQDQRATFVPYSVLSLKTLHTSTYFQRNLRLQGKLENQSQRNKNLIRKLIIQTLK